MTDLPLAARRTFRLALSAALALAAAYALALPLAFIAPMLAVLLGAAPSPPMGAKAIVLTVLTVLLTTGIGLLLVPLLSSYPLSGLLIVFAGLLLSTFVAVHKGQAVLGSLLTIGFTLITVAGSVDFALAVGVIQVLGFGVVIAIVCQWLVYPMFPEIELAQRRAVADAPDIAQSSWIALRTALIVMPAFVLALNNPSTYMAVIMKAVTLGQQSSMMNAHEAGRELLASTLLAGCCAVLFWFGLKLAPTLWMFFLWTALFGVYFAAKLYRVLATRFAPSFWINVFVTLLILLGPAVEDSTNGKDVYQAFASRMLLFVAITLYAWLAIRFLEGWRQRRRRRALSPSQPEAIAC